MLLFMTDKPIHLACAGNPSRDIIRAAQLPVGADIAQAASCSQPVTD